MINEHWLFTLNKKNLAQPKNQPQICQPKFSQKNTAS